ncbi:MAG: aminoglycoside phosphotransferase family protein [Gammaproteobacteria bacterium]|jgi:hypothetical protein
MKHFVSSNPWWAMAGTCKYERVLVSNTLNEDDLLMLDTIAEQIRVFDLVDLSAGELSGANPGGEVPAGKFDLLVINGLDGDLITDESLGRFVDRYLDENAQVLLLESNRVYFTNALRNPRGFFSALIGGRGNLIRGAFGAESLKRYETISYTGEAYESFLPGHYYTNKNSFLGSERLKRIILNSPISTFFYNSSLWVIQRGGRSADLVDDCRRELSRRPEIEWQGRQIKLVKTYYKHGKIILSLTSRKDFAPEHVLVIPMDRMTLRRRENEKRIVDELVSLELAAGVELPIISRGTLGKLTYFSMQEIPGITVDVDNSHMESMVQNAYRILKKLTIFPRPETPAFEEKKTVIVDAYLDGLLERYPPLKPDIERLFPIRELVAELPLVTFFHGDLKLENFLVDPVSYRINGIIDFEQSEMPGPALLDLLFLINYNLQTVEQNTFARAYARLVEGDAGANYQPMIDDYCKTFRIDDLQRRLCLVVFLIHHYSRRIHINVRNRKSCAEFTDCISRAESQLQRISEIRSEF